MDRSHSHSLGLLQVVQDPGANMPESRFRYLYERLEDHAFQLLANAVLTARFTDIHPLPLLPLRPEFHKGGCCLGWGA